MAKKKAAQTGNSTGTSGAPVGTIEPVPILKLKAGDRVQLKTGGPIMVVNNLKAAVLQCVWFDSKEQHNSKDFHRDTLRFIPDEVATHKTIKGTILEAHAEHVGELILSLREIVDLPKGTKFNDVFDLTGKGPFIRPQPEPPKISVHISGLDSSVCKQLAEVIEKLQMFNKAMGLPE